MQSICKGSMFVSTPTPTPDFTSHQLIGLQWSWARWHATGKCLITSRSTSLRHCCRPWLRWRTSARQSRCCGWRSGSGDATPTSPSWRHSRRNSAKTHAVTRRNPQRSRSSSDVYRNKLSCFVFFVLVFLFWGTIGSTDDETGQLPKALRSMWVS